MHWPRRPTTASILSLTTLTTLHRPFMTHISHIHTLSSLSLIVLCPIVFLEYLSIAPLAIFIYLPTRTPLLWITRTLLVHTYFYGNRHRRLVTSIDYVNALYSAIIHDTIKLSQSAIALNASVAYACCCAQKLRLSSRARSVFEWCHRVLAPRDALSVTVEVIPDLIQLKY